MSKQPPPDHADREAERLLYLWTNGGEGWENVPKRIAALLRMEERVGRAKAWEFVGEALWENPR
jgi:hypothetical protein